MNTGGYERAIHPLSNALIRSDLNKPGKWLFAQSEGQALPGSEAGKFLK